MIIPHSGENLFSLPVQCGPGEEILEISMNISNHLRQDTAQPSLWHRFMKLLFVSMPVEPTPTRIS
jgi:hypothetical protein